MNTTWRKQITYCMQENNDSWDNVVKSTLSGSELDIEFDSDFGMAEGAPFTLWTNQYVYFPVMYDGAEWVDCVPRNPCDIATEHAGG